MELFIAIGLERETAQRLCEFTGRALPEHPAEHPDDLHITLHYIGETEQGNEIARRLSRVAYAPFALRFAGLDCFLREDAHTNVIWQAVQDPDGHLAALRNGISAALEGISFSPASAFTPHITLSYTSRPFSPEALRRVTSPLAGEIWQVREFQLWQVLPGGKQPSFRKLAAYRLSGCTARQQAGILCVNDFHGVLQENAQDLGAARLTTAVKRYVRKYPETAVVFGGDNCFGEPVSDLLEGRPVLRMMKELNTKATVLGNHDFDLPVSALEKWPERGGCTLLAANLVERDSGENPAFVQPYTVVEVNGFRVALLGLCTQECLPGPDHPDCWAEYMLLDAGETAARYAALLEREKREGRLDAVIGLTHLGLKEMAGGVLDGEEALDAVCRAPSMDGMFTAHFHRFLQLMINAMPLVQGGGRGQGFSVLLLTFGAARELLSVVPLACDLHEKHEEYPPDPQVQAFVDEGFREVTPQLSEVIFTAAEDIHNRDMSDFSLPMTGTPLTLLATRVMQEETGCPIALAYAGRIGGAGFHKGPVTLYDFYKAYSFANILVTTQMTGAELWHNINIGMRTLAADGASPLAVGGLTVRVDPQKPWPHRVRDIRFPDGSPLRPEERYRVVIEDYLASNPFGFRFPDGPALCYHNRSIRSAMLQYFRETQTIYEEYPHNIILERQG